MLSDTEEDAAYLEHARQAPKALREHWRQPGWECFQPEGFYVTWGGLFEYAWGLLRCQLFGHPWNDSHYNLHDEPGLWRSCDRCFREETLRAVDAPPRTR